MNGRLLAGLVAAGIAAGGVALYRLGGMPGMPGMPGAGQAAARAPDPEAGRALYAEYCAACHGADLEGQANWQQPGPDGVFPAPPHDETGHTWHHGDRLLFDYVRLGGRVMLDRMGAGDAKSGMPAFGEVLSDDQIRDILAFIRSRWPERIREVQASRSAAERAGGG